MTKIILTNHPFIDWPDIRERLKKQGMESRYTVQRGLLIIIGQTRIWQAGGKDGLIWVVADLIDNHYTNHKRFGEHYKDLTNLEEAVNEAVRRNE